jgi:hypothetical protein
MYPTLMLLLNVILVVPTGKLRTMYGPAKYVVAPEVVKEAVNGGGGTGTEAQE